MKQGTIWLIGFCGILFAVLLGLGLYMSYGYGGGQGGGMGDTFIIASALPLIGGIAASLPTIIPILKERKYRRDLAAGKINTNRRKFRTPSYFDDQYDTGIEDEDKDLTITQLVEKAHTEFSQRDNAPRE